MYFENDNLFWKYANAKNLFWDKKQQLKSLASGPGAKPRPLNNRELKIVAKNPK